MRTESLIRLVEDDYALNDRRSMRHMLGHASRLLARMPDVPETTSEIVAYARERRAEGVKPQTVNNELHVLARGLSIAAERGIIDDPPHVLRLSVQNRQSGFLQPEDFWRSIAGMRALDRDAADLCEWLYLIGWRPSEATALEWDRDVDPDLGAVSLERTKTGYPRRVALGDALVEILRRRKDRADGSLIFHRRGSPIRSFYGAWYRALDAAEVRRQKPYAMRRSFARNATLAGVPIPVQMQIAGWRTISTYLRYCIIDESVHRDAFAEMAARQLEARALGRESPRTASG